MEMLYADDPILMVESTVIVKGKVEKVENRDGSKGSGKTKVMPCLVSRFQSKDSEKHIFDVCRKRVASNSIRCVAL